MKPGTRLWMLTALLWCACCGQVRAQAFSFSVQQTSLSDTVGAEMVFNATCANLTAGPLTLMFVRTINTMPDLWQSSMCLDVCYQPTTDTIATTAEYGSSPLQPGEVRPFSLHVYPMTNPGTGYVRILVMDRRNIADSIGVLFTASAVTSGVEQAPEVAAAPVLEQNYPNPFNGETTIGFRIQDREKGGWVTLVVYDVLGTEVARLLDGRIETPNGVATWNAAGFASGVYFSRLTVGGTSQCRRMALLK